VAEAGAEVHWSVRGLVDQFQGDHVFSGELEHGQTCPATDVDAGDFLISERGIEVE
jgi:hypothetical protein